MSKLGFDILLKNLKNAEKQFLRGGIQLAKTEFDKNFEKKSDDGDEQYTATPWEPLKYRREPPPILQLTGSMRSETSKPDGVQFGNGFALFIIDPKDKKGRGYAEYHHKGTDKMAMRRTVVQSNQLDFKQLNLLKAVVDRVFEGKGTFS